VALERLERRDEATAHLEELVERRPDDIEVIIALANVLRVRQQFAEAAEMYSRAIDLIDEPDRGHWSLFYFRGASYERSKQWDKAEADLKTALELVPETNPIGEAQVLNYLGYSWVDQGINIEEAFKLLQRAVELSPRDGMIIDSLGWAYYRLGRYEDAVRELERAVELKASDPVINDHLGDAYWKVGRRLEATFQWRHALASDPEPEEREKIERKLIEGLDGEGAPTAVQVPLPERDRAGG
jgi:tetratricopeptide (TPR) repeat protein